MASHYLALDLGAESGRLFCGRIEHGRLDLRELHRFPNTPLRANGSIHWQIDELFGASKTGLKKAAQLGLSYRSLSIDSWGVDYVLLDRALNFLAPSFHYRDPRSQQG